MQNLLPYAPVLASAVAIAAILSGLWQFRNTTRLNREAKAIDLFLKFNEIKEQLAKADRDSDQQAAFWRHNALVAVTEAVFRLTEGDAHWHATVDWMLQTQEWFLTQGPVIGASYSPRFLARMKMIVPKLLCT